MKEKTNVTLSLSVINLQWLANNVEFKKRSSYVDDLISSARELAGFTDDAVILEKELERLENEINAVLTKKAALTTQLKHVRQRHNKETQERLDKEKQIIDSLNASGVLGDL